MDGVGVMEWAGYKWSGAWMAGHGLKIKPRDHTVGTTGQWIISSVFFPHVPVFGQSPWLVRGQRILMGIIPLFYSFLLLILFPCY